MLDPESKGVAQVNAEQSLSRVLAYRVWEDQRRGWRFTNPNLEELGLVTAEYVSTASAASAADSRCTVSTSSACADAASAAANSPVEFARFVAEFTAKWAKVIHTANIRMD